MPRSIEEIQRYLDQSRQNINAVAQQTQRIDEDLQAMDEQKKQIARNALAPTQIENRRMLSSIQSHMATIESGFSVMQEELSKGTKGIEKASYILQMVDVESINKSTRDLNELLKLADLQEQSKLIEAINTAYEEKKKQLEKTYEEEKKELDSLIEVRKCKLNELNNKLKRERIKRNIVRVVVAFFILFILSFAVRWGTMLRNRISSKNDHTGIKTEQMEEKVQKAEKTNIEQNKGLIGWLFPESE